MPKTKTTSSTIADTLRAAQDAAVQATAAFQAEYDKLRRRYQTLTRERDRILAQPIPREDLIERMNDWIDEQQAKLMQRLKQELSFDQTTFSGKQVHQTPGLLRQQGTADKDIMLPFLRISTGYHATNKSDEFNHALLIGVLAEPIKEAIANHIDALPWYPEDVAPPREQREAMLAELDVKIDAVTADMDDVKADAKRSGITLKDRYQ